MVEEAIKDISVRSINKRVQFGETTLLIPEKTRINPKVGNIVDEKTGYGIPIIFSKESGCSSVFYSKRLSNNNYIELFYNRKNTRLNEIINKLVRANGFTRTCN
ncbi:hypothetical protein EII29_11430 [Leptotrichia sp. OH3620_COT-345]|nr:hypothetical protein EII29_11430 [Leptotrichia sp. OH3620_COT-345]